MPRPGALRADLGAALGIDDRTGTPARSSGAIAASLTAVLTTERPVLRHPIDDDRDGITVGVRHT
jgi:hypothetical protein